VAKTVLNKGSFFVALDEGLKRTLSKVAQFYDQRKVGDVGALGFRRSTDLAKLLASLERLLEERIILPGRSKFFDLGCADGRVNVFLSYLVKISVGVELDEWTLDEYTSLKAVLEDELGSGGYLPIPNNVFLFGGDSTQEGIHREIRHRTGVALGEFDIFYTYLVMHKEFASLLAERAKQGSLFMVYGLDKILPRYEGFRHLDHLSPLEGMLAIYRRE
jgi:hypothetical protein